jgi:Flp pilus assembly protein TadB
LKPDHEDTQADARDDEGADRFDLDAAADDDSPEADAAEAYADAAPRFPQLWLVAACLCLLAAAALWLLGHADAAFVAAALGVVAWFLNVRVRLRRKNSHGDTEAQG